MELRPYQLEAVQSILNDWESGLQNIVLVLPTGTGKTIVFAEVVRRIVSQGGRCLILAHRAELLNQAAEKLSIATGLGCAVEKAEKTAKESWYNVTVGSVQSFNPQRLERIRPDEYSHIIIDEAHHTLAETYMRVVSHFSDAKVLGVTATADRGDKRNLGQFYQKVSYEMTLPRAIREGWLVPIHALTLPVSLKISHSGSGDYTAQECASALEPYLDNIADQIKENAADRKTVVFMPLIATAQHFRQLLNERGINAREVNGESTDREECIKWFHDAPKGSVLCNAMLLTEGWDEPTVDAICVLRPTKVRSLYVQMVGRGTRLSENKKDLLLLDFLWMTERHELCRPAHLVAKNADLAMRMAEIMAENTNEEVNLIDAAEDAEMSAREEREETLRKELEEQRHRKRLLVDPLQYEYSIGGKEFHPDETDLQSLAPPSKAQLEALEKYGIFPDEIKCSGQASQILNTLFKRRTEGLTTPRQIRCLERYNFHEVGRWQFSEAKSMIDRIAGNGWRLPVNIFPFTYKPASIRAIE